MVRLSRLIAGQTLEVRTHDEPHLDEVFALWLAERFATPDWVARYAANGLTLGIEGGPFDEHARRNAAAPTNGNVKNSQSCTLLLANSLPLNREQTEALRRLVEYVHRVDTEGGGQPFDLNALVKSLHAVGTDSEEVVALVFKTLDAFYAQQRDFQAALRDIRNLRGVEIHLVRSEEGRAQRFLFLVAKTDHRMMAAAAMYLYKEALLAVVLKRSTGHVAILSNAAMKFPLVEVARRVRMAELANRQLPINTFDGHWIRQEGQMPDVPQWFYFAPGQMLLNGAWSHPDVPPTQLPLGRIVEAVRRGLTEQLQFTEPKSVTRR